jgi:solute carrier family 25 protein 39/40
MQRSQISKTEQALSACSGAVLVSAFTTPLDVVKVRLQGGGAGIVQPVCECCNAASTSSSSVLLRVVRHEGIGSLWSGFQPALLMSVPGTVLYFMAYESARDSIAERSPRLGEAAPTLAGGSARVVTTGLLSPIELMRTRMQADPALRGEGLIGGALSFVRREGVAKLWRGAVPTLWRDVPFSCLYWTVYEWLKRRTLPPPSPSGAGLAEPTPSAATSFGCGALAGAVSAFLTTPFDVVKTRREIGQRAGVPSTQGTFSLSRSILRDEGAAALFAGVGPRLAKVAPSCAIMIASYELGKGFFRRRAEQPPS